MLMKTNVQEISGVINVSYAPTIFAGLRDQAKEKQLTFGLKVKNNLFDIKTSALRVLAYKRYLNSFFVLILISIALTFITSPIWKP